MSSAKEFHLFKLTWPIFLEISLFMLLGIADTFMLSAISDQAVAGVGAANNYLHIAILVLEVIGNGASIVVSQFLGSRQPREAAKISALAVTLNTLIGIVISALFLMFNGPLLRTLNLTGEIYNYAQSYLSIVGGAIFLQAIINSLSAIIRVHGFTKQAMFVSLGMNVIHIFFNYAFIFGHFGFPELGVQGAAVSTVLSRSLALLTFLWLLYKVTEVKPEWMDYIRLSKERILKILKIGIPSAFEQIMYQACQMTFLFYVTFLGETSMAARQYAANISMFIYLFAIAIGMGTSIIVGRLVGADRQDQAYSRVWNSLRWAEGATCAMLVLIVLIRVPLLSLFSDDPEVIRLGAQLLVLGIILETGRTLNIVVINSLRAAGDAKYPLWIGIFSMVCMSLPLGYFLVFVLDMGVAGVWLAIAADEWTRAVIMMHRWKSRRWERYSLVQQTGREAIPAESL